jgi:hypothetical protein
MCSYQSVFITFVSTFIFSSLVFIDTNPFFDGFFSQAFYLLGYTTVEPVENLQTFRKNTSSTSSVATNKTSKKLA